MSVTSAPTARLSRDERRALILDSARQSFVSNGYHATSMEDIAEASGVSKPVVYQHFESKLELYLDLLEASCTSLETAVAQALDSTSENKLRVARAVGAYFDFVEEDRGSYRLIFESDLPAEPQVGKRIEQSNDVCVRLIAAVIAEDTGLSSDEALLLSSGLIGSAQTAARQWLRTKSSVPKTEAKRLVSALTWRGISTFPKSHPATNSSTSQASDHRASPDNDASAATK